MKKNTLLLLATSLFALAACGPTNSTDSVPGGSTTQDSGSELPAWVDYAASVHLQLDYEGKDFFKDGVGQMKKYYAIDGDTAHFDPMVTTTSSERIKCRFYGIDTPESTGAIEPWGQSASKYTKSILSEAIENGTVVFEKDTVTISFTRVLTQEEEQEGAAQQAEAGETRLELVIAIKELGSFKGAATLPAAEAAFASVSQEDRLFAQAQWLFGATSAQIGAEFYGADEAAIAQYTAQLSEGQALAQLTYRGEAAMTSAVVLRGDDYYEVTPEDSAPVRGSAGRNVQRALRDFGFSALERESFALKAGTDDTLVFVGAAGAGFPACEAAELCCKADGSYTITLTGITEADLVGAESATVTLQKIGQAQPIAFPAAVTEALDAYFADLDA